MAITVEIFIINKAEITHNLLRIPHIHILHKIERINDNTFRRTTKYADAIFRTDTNTVTVTLKKSDPWTLQQPKQ